MSAEPTRQAVAKNATVWDRPPDGSPPAAAVPKGVPPPPEWTPPDVQLPAGWTSEKDPATGRVYFLDHKTKATHWELPGPPPTHLTPSPDALGESKEACKSIVCAVKDGVRVRKPGPIPSDSFAKGVVKYNATITVLPDPVSSKKGEQYFALADGSGYVPVNTKKGNAAFALTINPPYA